MYTTNFGGGGFLDGMLDADSIREMFGSVGGGAAHAMIDGLLAQNVSFFADDGSTTGLLKRGGLSLALGVAGGALLWGVNQDMAKGALGSTGASLARLVADRAGVGLGSARGRRRMRGARRRRMRGARVATGREEFQPLSQRNRQIAGARAHSGHEVLQPFDGAGDALAGLAGGVF